MRRIPVSPHLWLLVLVVCLIASESALTPSTLTMDVNYFLLVNTMIQSGNAIFATQDLISGDYGDLYILHRTDGGVKELRLTATASKWVSESISYSAGDQFQLQYRGSKRVGYVNHLSLGTQNDLLWMNIFIPNFKKYPELEGFQLFQMTTTCKQSDKVTAITSAGGSVELNNNFEMIEMLYPFSTTLLQNSDLLTALGNSCVIVQKTTGGAALAFKSYGSKILFGWRNKDILKPDSNNKYDLSIALKLSMTSYDSQSAYCGCSLRQANYLNENDECTAVTCPSGTPKSIAVSSLAAYCTCDAGSVWSVYSQKCEAISTKTACLASTSVLCGEGPVILTDADCQADLLSTGLLLSERNECQCTQYAFWNSEKSQCSPYCYMDAFSTGVAADDSSCTCKDHFTWSVEKAKCVLDCSTVEGSTKQPKGELTCECKAPANWNFGTLTCDGDCSSISFSTGSVDTANGGCICEDGFAWNATKKVCEINCELASEFSDKTRLAVNQCGCKSGALWSFDALDCIRNCSAYEFATGLNLNPADCICQDGYKWISETPKCQLDCGKRPGELSTYNSDAGYCDCDEPAYFFSYQLGVCAIDCTDKAHTRQSLYPSALSCECILGYAWNATNGATGNCSLSCNGPFDTGSIADEKCVCKVKAFFDSYSNACAVNCRVDPLSTKVFTGSACACKDNAEWISAENACKCKSGFKFNSSLNKCEAGASSAAVGALAGVLATSVAVLIGKVLYDKRANKEEAQSEGHENRQSQQGLKIEEAVQ